MFITLGRLPNHPAAISRAAQLAGLTPSEAARLLAGTFPRVRFRTVKAPEVSLHPRSGRLPRLGLGSGGGALR